MLKMRYIFLGFAAFIILFVVAFSMTANYTRKEMGVKETGHIYVITVDDRENPSTHTSDSIYFESERCIEFRNEFGFKQKECGDRVSKIQIR